MAQAAELKLFMVRQPPPQDFTKGPVYGRASGVYGYRWDGWSRHWIMPPPPRRKPVLRPGQEGFDLKDAIKAERARARVKELRVEKEQAEAALKYYSEKEARLIAHATARRREREKLLVQPAGVPSRADGKYVAHTSLAAAEAERKLGRDALAAENSVATRASMSSPNGWSNHQRALMAGGWEPHPSASGRLCHPAHKEAFRLLDKDGSGKVDAKELRQAMREMGHQVTLAEAVKMVKAVDEDGDGEMDMVEFLNFMDKASAIGQQWWKVLLEAGRKPASRSGPRRDRSNISSFSVKV